MRTKSFYPFAGQYHPVDIFGYSTKGIPGIEIVGLGKYGRGVKEKFIFLSREKKLKFPMKRYVLCVEGEIEGKKFQEEEYRYLELPLLLMLWSLTGNLQVNHLDDCLAIGKIAVTGEVTGMNLDDERINYFNELLCLEEGQHLKVIAPRDCVNLENYYHLPVDDLMASLVCN